MNRYTSSLYTLSIFIFILTNGGIFQEINDYYGISRNLTFNKAEYQLAWSTHPNDIYYKQEYVPHGESIDRFSNMILIDFVNNDLPIKDVIQSQILKLVERKKIDIVCNYQLLKNEEKGDYILDFLISESNNNKINTLEWNAYHYTSYVDKKGHKGILLFGFSHRAYGNKTNDFLTSFKNYRKMLLLELTHYHVPEIQLK